MTIIIRPFDEPKKRIEVAKSFVEIKKFPNFHLQYSVKDSDFIVNIVFEGKVDDYLYWEVPKYLIASYDSFLPSDIRVDIYAVRELNGWSAVFRNIIYKPFFKDLKEKIIEAFIKALK